MTFDPENDADWDTADLQESAAAVANGVCPICEEPLRPLDPKWAGTFTAAYTAETAAQCLGPVHPTLPYHTDCLEPPA